MRKQLTEQQKLFLDVLFDEARGDLKKAKELAGFSANTRVSDAILGIKERIIEKAKEVLAAHAVKAATTLIDGMDGVNGGGPDARLKKESAESVLDRIGIAKNGIMDGNTAGPGYIFILPPKNPS